MLKEFMFNFLLNLSMFDNNILYTINDFNINNTQVITRLGTHMDYLSVLEYSDIKTRTDINITENLSFRINTNDLLRQQSIDIGFNFNDVNISLRLWSNLHGDDIIRLNYKDFNIVYDGSFHLYYLFRSLNTKQELNPPINSNKFNEYSSLNWVYDHERAKEQGIINDYLDPDYFLENGGVCRDGTYLTSKLYPNSIPVSIKFEGNLHMYSIIKENNKYYVLDFGHVYESVYDTLEETILSYLNPSKSFIRDSNTYRYDRVVYNQYYKNYDEYTMKNKK